MLSLTKTEAQSLKLKLKKIKQHLDAAQTIFSTLSSDQNHWCFDKHVEGNSLNHIVRWGPQTVDDLIELLVDRDAQ